MPGVSGAVAGTYVKGKYFGSLAPASSSQRPGQRGPGNASRVTGSSPSMRASARDTSISMTSRKRSPRVASTPAEGIAAKQSKSRVTASGAGAGLSSTHTVDDYDGGVSSLRRQEVERIVKRVASHYVAKLASMVQDNKKLQLQVTSLEGTVAEQQRTILALRRSVTTDASSLVGASIHPAETVPQDESRATGLAETVGRSSVLTESIMNIPSSAALPSPRSVPPDAREVNALRKALFAEKRQRLMVEEQTQRLAEQHAVLISTLEQRLHKQESQIRDIIRAAENGAGASRSSLPHSTLSSPRQDYTPRHLLQQHLSQHQQTQEVLDKYRSLLGEKEQQQAGPIAAGEGKAVTDQSLLMPTKIRGDDHGFAGGPELSGIETPEDTGRSHLDEVQEITAFLDQITEQLEGLDDGECAEDRGDSI